MEQQTGSTQENRLVQNWERSTRLYIITFLLNLYAEYTVQNAGLDDSQAGIKTAGRNNLRHHFHGRKQRGTMEPLDEGEREE